MSLLKKIKYTRFLSLLAFLLPVVLLCLHLPVLNTPPVYFFAELDKGWDVSGAGQDLVDSSTGNVRIRLWQKGDSVTMTHFIPAADSTVIAPCLMFTTTLAKVIVTAEGEELYRYGQEADSQGLMVPKTVHYVSVDGLKPGTAFSIEITATEHNSFQSMPRVYYGNRADLQRFYIQNRRLPTFVGIFLCFFAMVLFALSSYLYMYHSRDLSLLLSSAISFMFGVYILCYTGSFCYLTDNQYFFTFSEYMTLYLIPMALVAFLCVDQHELLSEHGTRRIMLGLLITDTLIPIVIAALHLGGIAHVNVFLTPIHILFVLEFLVIVPILIKKLGSRILRFREEFVAESDSSAALGAYTRFMSGNCLLAGILVFMICALIDMAKFNVLKFILQRDNTSGNNINFIVFGAVFFVVCLLLNYFFHSVAHINAGNERTRLEEIAYSDPLTGLKNRTYCEEVMSSLTGDFTIISIDLDHLKQVNDNLGHEEGDRLISTFAGFLSKAFPDARLLARTGGDEFIAAFNGVNTEMCEERLTELQGELDGFNSEDHPFRLSASWGYAMSSEMKRQDDTPMDVYKLADARMYAMKESHHEKRVRRILADINTQSDRSDDVFADLGIGGDNDV